MIETTIDYKALLEKYIDHVGNAEGVVFICDPYGGHDRRPQYQDPFTDEEWAELRRMAMQQ